MEVNSQQIKNLRTERAYTQQHLADACAVSLRTIQRVERYGVASSETVMSLSAVFGVTSDTLLNIVQDETAAVKATPFPLTTILIAGCAGALLGALTTYLAVTI